MIQFSNPMEINVSRGIYANCMKKWTIADKDNRNSLGYTCRTIIVAFSHEGEKIS